MKIILNSEHTHFRNENTPEGNFSPLTLEILYDDEDEEDEFRVGLVVTADWRDLEYEEGNAIRLKAAWSTPKEFSKWIGQLVSLAALAGLTNSDDLV